jgi:hypothetical protein
MPTKIYEIQYVYTANGREIEVCPLKIKYLKQFMDTFNTIKTVDNEEDVLKIFIKCATIAMKQFSPDIKTIEDFEDNFDMKTMHKILKNAGGIDLEKTEQAPVQVNTEQQEKSSWENLDLVKLESEAFLLGIWKNFDELELSLSIPELMIILEQKRENDYQDKRFSAGIAGVDLEDNKTQEVDPWEAMKARVAAKESGIGNGDPNDITSLQGQKAQQMGFGIGMGLDYENLT